MEPMMSPKLAPYLIVRGAAGLGKFIEEGIGGTAGFRQQDSDGTVNHLEFRIADSVVMIADTPKDRDPFPAMIHLYVHDADAAYQRALRAGATSVRQPTAASDGYRGGVRDAWGNQWWFTSPSKRT
jgi:PhnB protein